MPVKPLYRAKSRLRGAADSGVGDPDAHAALALALMQDTVAAVLTAGTVRRLLVISSDPAVAAELAAVGVEVAPDVDKGHNGAQGGQVGLRAEELDDAVRAAAAIFATGPGRSFCADADGSGTTFLLAATGVGLDPRFGAGSAARHRASGAVELAGSWPGLRHDVDTGDDLCAAAALGLGASTARVWAPTGHC